jgi:hypothetical protein
MENKNRALNVQIWADDFQSWIPSACQDIASYWYFACAQFVSWAATLKGRQAAIGLSIKESERDHVPHSAHPRGRSLRVFEQVSELKLGPSK